MAYTFEENGTWGHYDDGIKGLMEFHQKRPNLGFTESKKLHSLLGSVTVYPRTDAKTKWPYGYVCLVEIVSGYVWVWIKNIPTLFAFLKHIQAHEAEDRDVRVSNLYELIDSDNISNYLTGTYFAEAMSELHTYFKKKNSEQGGK